MGDIISDVPEVCIENTPVFDQFSTHLFPITERFLIWLADFQLSAKRCKSASTQRILIFSITWWTSQIPVWEKSCRPVAPAPDEAGRVDLFPSEALQIRHWATFEAQIGKQDQVHPGNRLPPRAVVCATCTRAAFRAWL